MASHEKVDLVIVGAGPAGSIYADAATRAGRTVVLLEFGPDRQDKDLISSEIWARRLKHAPPHELAGRNPVAVVFQAGWGAGGSMNHFFANFPRLLPSDFHARSLYGKGSDWPIGYDDLAPYYDRVARGIGVSGDAAQEQRWRPVDAAYPMPPLQSFRHGEIWRDAFEASGIPLAPMPAAINSTEYDGRPGCMNDGWCHAGCPIGAIGSPKWNYLGAARSRGAEFRPFSTVSRILTSADGRHATGVEYFDDRGERNVQEASAVVLAAFAAETPRILLNSANAKHEQGLANGSGLVGRNVMCHTGASVWAIFDEPVQNYLGTTAAQFMAYVGYPKNRSEGGFGSALWTMGAALKPNGGLAGARPDLFGPALADFMKRAAHGLTRISFYGEEMPRPENRVELSGRKDEHGFPIARITHAFDQDARDLWRATTEQGLEIARRANAREVWAGTGPEPPTIHIIGGTMMGTSAANSVANSYGQTHEVANLFLGGAGLFPTEGPVHPTNTLMALALRGAEYMTSNWGSISG